ncbi:unnamed protein product, partial [Phaeothamnion confervicola]
MSAEAKASDSSYAEPQVRSPAAGQDLALTATPLRPRSVVGRTIGPLGLIQKDEPSWHVAVLYNSGHSTNQTPATVPLKNGSGGGDGKQKRASRLSRFMGHTSLSQAKAVDGCGRDWLPRSRSADATSQAIPGAKGLGRNSSAGPSCRRSGIGGSGAERSG